MNFNIDNFNKKQKIIIISIISISLIIIYFVYNRKNDEFIESEEGLNINEDKIIDEEKKETTYIIHISGAVNNEGVYKINENSRISDAIELAGGLKEDADISKINLAYKLEDGMKIFIPNINDNKEYEENDITEEFIEYQNKSDNTNNNSKNSKVNINTATQTQLETLPGIGPSTALKIINYRIEKGKFSKIDDIKNVSGIGNGKFDKIKDLICI